MDDVIASPIPLKSGQLATLAKQNDDRRKFCLCNACWLRVHKAKQKRVAPKPRRKESHQPREERQALLDKLDPFSDRCPSIDRVALSVVETTAALAMCSADQTLDFWLAPGIRYAGCIQSQPVLVIDESEFLVLPPLYAPASPQHVHSLLRARERVVEFLTEREFNGQSRSKRVELLELHRDMVESHLRGSMGHQADGLPEAFLLSQFKAQLAKHIEARDIEESLRGSPLSDASKLLEDFMQGVHSESSTSPSLCGMPLLG